MSGALQPPVAIGGVGGSGTRLVARILGALEYYLGDDLNPAHDNLWFTLLFNHAELGAAGAAHDGYLRSQRLFLNAMRERRALAPPDERWLRSLGEPPHAHPEWNRGRIASLLAALQAAPRRDPRWGWKEPNSHVFLDRLAAALPGMKYVHVMRNGLDVAHGENQRQLRLWGALFLDGAAYEMTPRWSLKYWCRVHRRVIELGRGLPGRFLLLNYDAFCARPEHGLRELLGFLGLAPAPAEFAALLGLVEPPPSMGRWLRHGLEVFDAEDVAYVRSLGF